MLIVKTQIVTSTIIQDIHHAKSIMETVNLWSAVHIAFMLIVGLLQVRRISSNNYFSVFVLGVRSQAVLCIDRMCSGWKIIIQFMLLILKPR